MKCVATRLLLASFYRLYEVKVNIILLIPMFAFFQLSSFEQTVSVVKQISYALAVGESACQLEHRDLHWGNILAKSCGSKTRVKGQLRGQAYSFRSEGVKVSVIDFTLSRLNHIG